MTKNDDDDDDDDVVVSFARRALSASLLGILLNTATGLYLQAAFLFGTVQYSCCTMF